MKADILRSVFYEDTYRQGSYQDRPPRDSRNLRTTDSLKLSRPLKLPRCLHRRRIHVTVMTLYLSFPHTSRSRVSSPLNIRIVLARSLPMGRLNPRPFVAQQSEQRDTEVDRCDICEIRTSFSEFRYNRWNCMSFLQVLENWYKRIPLGSCKYK